MPRRDGTGPLGRGAMTGKGLGICDISNTYAQPLPVGRRSNGKFGVGVHWRRGGLCRMVSGADSRLGWERRHRQEHLQSEKELLKRQLRFINDKLEHLDE